MEPPPASVIFGVAPSVLFADLNSFYASVEQMDRPAWRGRPLVVVQVPVDTAAVIAASIEARALGVRVGARVAEAVALCPELVVTTARHDRYQKVHAEFVELARRVLGPVSVFSVDEIACHLAPGTSAVAARRFAQDLKEELRHQYDGQLRCSIGIAANVFLAKVASAMEKPDGLVVLDESQTESFLMLPLIELPGIGPATLERLARRGIATLPELLARSPGDLKRAWGSVLGERFYHMVRGSREHDYRAPNPDRRKSVSASQLMPPEFRQPADAREACMRLLTKALRRLRGLGLEARRAEFEVIYRHTKGTGLTWNYRTRAALAAPAGDDLTWRKAAASVIRPPAKPPLEPFSARVTLQELNRVEEAREKSPEKFQRASDLAEKIDELNARFGHVIGFGAEFKRRSEPQAGQPSQESDADEPPVTDAPASLATAVRRLPEGVRVMIADRYGWPTAPAEWAANLLPVQASALEEGLADDERLLKRSGIVAAPTSAGKTLVAEMRMLHRWSSPDEQRKKTVMLVPTREIGLERWRALRDAYGQREGGRSAQRLVVVYSDGDHHAHDSLIWDGKFDVAVMVNEKFRFFVQNPRFLLDVGEVVFDEVAFVADPERGAFLEAALLSVVAHPDPPTVLGLTHPVDDLTGLIDTLATPAGPPFLLRTVGRPIPIAIGIWSAGREEALFRDCNTGAEERVSLYLPYPVSLLNTIRDLLLRYLESAEAELRNNVVFAMPTKRHVLDTATAIATLVETDDEIAELMAANRSTTLVVNRLKSLEPSRISQLLERIVPLGIGIHTADLSLAERRLIGQAFREGEIPVLICTSTMAHGVNLPAQSIVFLNWGQNRRSSDPQADLIPYCRTLEKDFVPWLGRVGRVGQPLPRQRLPEALYVSIGGPGSYEYETVLGLIRRQSVAIEPGHTTAHSLPGSVLFAVNTLYHRTGEPVTTSQVLDFFSRAPGGHAEDLLARVEEVLTSESHPAPAEGEPTDRLTDASMAALNSVAREGEAAYTVTLLGRIASANGVSPETCRALRLFLRGPDPAQPLDLLDILALLRATPDGATLVPMMIRKDYQPVVEARFSEVLAEIEGRLGAGWREHSPLLSHLPQSVHLRGTFLALRDWCRGRDLLELERELGLAPTDANLYEKARGYARLVRLFSTLAKTQPGRDRNRPAEADPAAIDRLLPEHDLELLAEELLHGVPGPAVDLARLGIENMARAWVMRLTNAVATSHVSPDLPFLERLRLVAEEDDQRIFDALPTFGLAARVRDELQETARRPLGDRLRHDPDLVARYCNLPFVARAQLAQGIGRYTALKMMHRNTYAVFRRNETKGVPIVFRDTGDVGLWVDRGAVEFLAEIGTQEPTGRYATDRLFVDLDPQNGYELSNLKEVAAEVFRRVSRHQWVDPERCYLHWTGGKGFHVVGHCRGDQLREVEKVKAELDEIVANFCDDVSIFKEPLAAIYEPYAVLDLSPVMRRGVYRNAFSFHSAAGGICVPVRAARLKEFTPEVQGSVEWVSAVAGNIECAEGDTFDELVRRYWVSEEKHSTR